MINNLKSKFNRLLKAAKASAKRTGDVELLKAVQTAHLTEAEAHLQLTKDALTRLAFGGNLYMDINLLVCFLQEKDYPEPIIFAARKNLQERPYIAELILSTHFGGLSE